MMEFLSVNGSELLVKTWEHFYLSIISLIIGILIAVPLGMAIANTKKSKQLCINNSRRAADCTDTRSARADDSALWSRTRTGDYRAQRIYPAANFK